MPITLPFLQDLNSLLNISCKRTNTHTHTQGNFTGQCELRLELKVVFGDRSDSCWTLVKSPARADKWSWSSLANHRASSACTFPSHTSASAALNPFLLGILEIQNPSCAPKRFISLKLDSRLNHMPCRFHDATLTRSYLYHVLIVLIICQLWHQPRSVYSAHMLNPCDDN